jgi:hypothetical protein
MKKVGIIAETKQGRGRAKYFELPEDKAGKFEQRAEKQNIKTTRVEVEGDRK